MRSRNSRKRSNSTPSQARIASSFAGEMAELMCATVRSLPSPLQVPPHRRSRRHRPARSRRRTCRCRRSCRSGAPAPRCSSASARRRSCSGPATASATRSASRSLMRDEPFTLTSHPDHVKSLMTARPEDAPSLTGESPLRPIVGPNSTLTALGERHMRQRKLHLPSFHGEAVARYSQMISRGRREGGRLVAPGRRDRARVAHAERDARRDHGRRLRRRGHARAGHARARPARVRAARVATSRRRRSASSASCSTPARTSRSAASSSRSSILDRYVYAVIAARRADPDAGARNDILSTCCAPRPRTASTSPTSSCATSCSRSCSPATRRPRTSCVDVRAAGAHARRAATR